MFVRVNPSGKYHYLQVVQNYREGAKVKQKVDAQGGIDL